MQALTRYFEEVTANPKGNRRRSVLGSSRSEIRIRTEHYTATVLKVLRAGNILLTPHSAPPRICMAEPLPAAAWGFNAQALRRAAMERDWMDKQLISVLLYGFADYSGDSPPVSCFSPHQSWAYEEPEAFTSFV